MKLVDLHYSQLTVNDHSADMRSGRNFALSSPAYSPPLSPTGKYQLKVAHLRSCVVAEDCVISDDDCLALSSEKGSKEQFRLQPWLVAH